MPQENRFNRSFSDAKHRAGQWRAAIPGARIPFSRALLNYLSFKRAGVDALAQKLSSVSAAIAVDLGAGQGAYAHWFLTGSPRALKRTVLAVDWSCEALSRIPPPRTGKILRCCADATRLPLKPGSIDALFSCDTLGHVGNIPRALDEMARVLKGGAPLFLHAECADYRSRWPDAMLIQRTKRDFLAEYDGHGSLLPVVELRSLYVRRFHLDGLFSAAGLTGWLTGYPEKYRLAFTKAGLPLLAALTAIFATIKHFPPTGILLRLFNATLNRLEIAVGLTNGGSCCARLHVPLSTDAPGSR